VRNPESVMENVHELISKFVISKDTGSFLTSLTRDEVGPSLSRYGLIKTSGTSRCVFG
jgi:hypothetical protein